MSGINMNKERIFEIVKKQILDILPVVSITDIELSKQLKDLGANSMDRMEIVISSMEEVGVKIPLLEFAKVANIDGLVTLLYEKYHA